jgi:hypothetical protein
MSRTRVGLVGIVAAGLMLMTAGAASATPEPTSVTTSAREVLSLGDGWFSNTPVYTTVITDVTESVRTKSEDTTETDVKKAGESRVNETTETRTTDAVYQANVLPPINPDGTSVWPAKRGVIPVQFKVTKSGKVEERSVSMPQSRTVTTVSERTVTTPYTATDVTTETTTIKEPIFVSTCPLGDVADDDWSVLGNYEIPAGTTVKDISKVQAGFNWQQGASVGGSLRWDIGTEYGDIHVYYGDSHNWTGQGGSGVNLMDATDDRFDDGNLSVGGTFYNTKAELLQKVGDAKVNNVSLVVDSCWKNGNQRLDIDYVTVGINSADSTKNDPLASKTSIKQDKVEGDWVAGAPTNGPWSVIDVQEGEWVDGPPESIVYGPWTEVSSTAGVQTNEPPAKLVVKKFNDGVQTEVLSETLTSAQADVGGNFRQVDHKYIYNLEASTLSKGDFKVYIQIDGVNLENHGEFTLR